MSKPKTLFSYFTKSPKSSNPSQSNNVSSPASKAKNTPLKSKQQSKPAVTCEYDVHDLVWAKLEGFPFWPALVCSSPGNEKQFVRGKNHNLEAHVQFFDKPPSRAWIKVKFLKRFSGARHPEIPPMKDEAWKSGVEEACKALELKSEQRASLVIQHLESNGEDDLGSDDPSDTENSNRLSSKKKRPSENSKMSKPKRRRIVLPSDNESEDEYKPDETISSEEENGVLSVHETDDEHSPSPSPEPSPVKTPKTKKTKPKSSQLSFSASKPPAIEATPVRQATKSKLSSFSFSEDVGKASGESKVWTHLKLDWLKPDHIKDINGKPKGDPDYDPRTLFVPSSFKQGLTPAVRQWWEMKSRHFDTILFFKVGKFYELYHMDAVIGINELNLREMAGDYAHSGFPEISYGRYSSVLIQKGYKVARVEQTETPQMMEERCKKMSKPTKFDKVVNREICAITTKGTCTFGVQDGEAMSAGSNHLLCLAEKEKSSGDSLYGVCFVDTSIGKFYLGQFFDDRHCSRLRTLIAHFPPAQVLFEKNHSSKKTQTILNCCLISTMKESLTSGREFWDAPKTLKYLAESSCFKEDSSDCIWPDLLKKMLDPDDPLNQKACMQYELAVKALGACTWYLKKCFIDEELLSMKNFEEYVPPDTEMEPEASSSLARQHMVLDGITLRNLELLENSIGTSEGTLLDAMEHCYTPFGKRLFHQWMCSPLCNPDDINDRLNAIEDLEKIQATLDDVSKSMKKLPDLERLLSRIHAQGSAHRSENHPDGRAVFYEANVYTKRKIGDLITSLQGFKTACEINVLINDSKLNIRSAILKDVVLKTDEGGRFPELKDILHFFDNAFDHEEAKKLGKIIPSKGVDEEFDTAEKDIAGSKRKLDQYLEKQRKYFGCKVTYFHSGKNRFQIEVPEHACKHASTSYELVSQKKGFKRYWTSEIKAETVVLTAAEEKRELALKDIMRRLFHQFDKHFKKWECAVRCLAVLDCLLSLVHYHLNSQVSMCRPVIVLPSENQSPYMRINNGCHPALIKRLTGGDFIPNDISVGEKENSANGKVVLVTGPNMGGKSTLMRQSGLLTVMAQMGSYVPAEEFELTPVDRVFTRLGASDRILEGESTFFVELSETASILKHATEHSLVLLDELGRGTATYDGTAIAFAVAQDLASRLKCRTLFSTHYHSLVDHFSNNPDVRLGHMSCMVENENEEDPTQETITFLYKFVEGACPKSYGFNAARLAGIPDSIIRTGFQKAKEFESKSLHMKMLRLLFRASKLGISHLVKDVQEKLSIVL